jgi:hypothetical protein
VASPVRSEPHFHRLCTLLFFRETIIRETNILKFVFYATILQSSNTLQHKTKFTLYFNDTLEEPEDPGKIQLKHCCCRHLSGNEQKGIKFVVVRVLRTSLQLILDYKVHKLLLSTVTSLLSGKAMWNDQNRCKIICHTLASPVWSIDQAMCGYRYSKL